MSFHPNGIPVQAFGIIGDGSCEWTKWEAMFQAIGGDIGGDEMRGQPIWAADPVSPEREFVVRGPIFARDGITVNIHNCTIRNANVTTAPVEEGGDPYTDTHQAVFWVGKWNPAGLQIGQGAGAEAWAGALGVHALEDGDIGDDFVTLSSLADASLFSPGDRVYIYNSYRQMMTICREVDAATGKVYLTEELFWNLTKIPSTTPEVNKNWCSIFNLSTAEGRGTHNSTFFPSVDPLFSGPESIYYPAHCVRDFSVVGHGGARLVSDNWSPISIEAGYGGRLENFDQYGRGGWYSNAQTHMPMRNIKVYVWNYFWEFADGARNSPMENVDFYITPLRERWVPSADQSCCSRIGQMTHHKNIRVFNSIDWSTISSGPTFYVDDGFCYKSSLDGFEFHVLNHSGTMIWFSGRAPVSPNTSEDGNPSVTKSPETARALQERGTYYRKGKVVFHQSAPQVYIDTNSFTLDGYPRGLWFEDVEIVDPFERPLQSVTVNGDTSGGMRNCKIPGYLYINIVDKNLLTEPFTAMENWRLDNVECDGVYTFNADLVGNPDTAIDAYLVQRPTIDGNIGGPIYEPRVARDSRIIRRGMLPLKNWEEYGGSVYRQTTGDLWRFEIPPGLPWVINDEIEFRLQLQIRRSNFVDRVVSIQDRATDADAWQTIIAYTQAIGEGAESEDQENMWHECIVRMKVSEIVPDNGAFVPNTPVRIQWTASYISPVRTVHNSCSRGTRNVVPIDLLTDGRQFRVHVEQGSDPLGPGVPQGSARP